MKRLLVAPLLVGLLATAACSSDRPANQATPTSSSRTATSAAPRVAGSVSSAPVSPPPSGTNRPPLMVLPTGDIFDGWSVRQIDAYMQDVVDSGHRAIRTDFKHSDVQRKAGGAYDWTHLRRIVDSAAQHGILVQPIFNSTAPWATPGCPEKLLGHCAPQDVQVMAKFAGAAIREFPSRLFQAEYRNEASSEPDYFQNPALYAAEFRTVRHAIQEAEPSMVVLPSGTAAIGTSSPQEGLSAPDWYEALFKAGLGPIMPQLTIHPYTWPATPGRTDSDSNWAQIEAVLDIAARYGFSGTPANLGETGFPTGGGQGSAATDRYPQWRAEQPVTEENQERFLADTFAECTKLLARGKLAGIGVYTLRDDPQLDPASTEAHFGLIATDGRKKPAWQAVHDYAANHR